MFDIKLSARYTALFAHLCLIVAEILWGSMVVFSKSGLETIHPSVFSCLRSSLAAIIFFIVASITDREKLYTKPTESEFKNYLAMGISVGLFTILLTFGLQLSTATNAVILEMTSIPFTSGIAICSGREPFSPLRSLGVFLGAAGGLIMVEVEKSQLTGPYFLGNILLSIEGLIFAIYLIMGEVVYKTKPATVVNFYTNTFGAILNIAYTGIAHRDSFKLDTLISMDMWTWASIIYSVSIGSVIAYQIYSWGLRNTSAVISSVYFPVQALSGMVLAALFLGEHMASRVVVGGFTVFVGVSVVLYTQKKTEGEEKDCKYESVDGGEDIESNARGESKTQLEAREEEEQREEEEEKEGKGLEVVVVIESVPTEGNDFNMRQTLDFVPQGNI